MARSTISGGRGLAWQAPPAPPAEGAAELVNGPFDHLGREGVAGPALPVLHLGGAAALDGASQDDRRPLAAEVAGLGQGLVDRRGIVAVDLEHAGTERLDAAAVGLQVPAEVGGAALAEPVD